MIHIHTCYNAESAKNYRAADEPLHDVSYFGKGFEYLGIAPEDMDRLKFNRLLDNRIPDRPDKPKLKPEKLTPRDRRDPIYDEKGRVVRNGGIACWNVTMSPVKAWTIAEMMSPLADKMREKRKEVEISIFHDYIEPMAQARNRLGKHSDRDSGNLLAERHGHSLTRPVDGKVMPQCHAHFFIANATYDTQRAKPGFIAVKMHQAFFQVPRAIRAYNRRLRAAAEELGLETKGFGNRWTIVGVEKSTTEKFSIRRDQVRDNRKAGIPEKFVGLVDRAPKRVHEDLDQLKAQWSEMLDSREKERLLSLAPRPKWGRRLQPRRERRWDLTRHVERLQSMVPTRREAERDGPERG